MPTLADLLAVPFPEVDEEELRIESVLQQRRQRVAERKAIATGKCARPGCEAWIYGRPGVRKLIRKARNSQLYCSKTCAHDDLCRLRKLRGDEQKAVQSKICQHCGEPFVRHQKESRERFAKRTACSRVCGRRSRTWKAARPNRTYPPKQCPVCGDIFSRREHEQGTGYDKRKTCGRECGAALQVRTKAAKAT